MSVDLAGKPTRATASQGLIQTTRLHYLEQGTTLFLLLLMRQLGHTLNLPLDSTCTLKTILTL